MQQREQQQQQHCRNLAAPGQRNIYGCAADRCHSPRLFDDGQGSDDDFQDDPPGAAAQPLPEALCAELRSFLGLGLAGPSRQTTDPRKARLWNCMTFLYHVCAGYVIYRALSPVPKLALAGVALFIFVAVEAPAWPT